MKTEKDKMLTGEFYNALDPQLSAERRSARNILAEFNRTLDEEESRREALLRSLFGEMGENVWIEPPFYCDYGCNIKIGNRVFLNFNCVILDCSPIYIGDNVKMGPSVQIYGATHPVEVEMRRAGLELGKPIVIESDVWIGGGSILCPGVNIGMGSVIGAGSVVTRDIPSGVIAVGNPCRVLRPIPSPNSIPE